MDEAFAIGASDEEVLFELKVTRRWLRQLILALTLICRGSYRSVIEFLRDLVGGHVSAGTAHNVHAAAAELRASSTASSRIARSSPMRAAAARAARPSRQSSAASRNICLSTAAQMTL